MTKQYPLVLGASGMTGTETIRQVSSKGIDIRVTYREQSDLNILRNYGVEPFYADLAEPATIRKAMIGIKNLIAILPIHPMFEEWGKSVIDCAVDAGIKHYVALSNFSVGSGAAASISTAHHKLEKYLMKSGLPYTILRPSTYFQNLQWTAITIRRQKRFSLPLENAKIPHIDMRDTSAALIEVLMNSEPHLNKTYTLTGGQALSMFDVAHTISDTLGETIRYYPTPLEAATDSFRDLGLIESTSRMVSDMYKDYATIDLSAVSGDFKTICGRAPITFESYIKEHADIFTSKR